MKAFKIPLIVLIALLILSIADSLFLTAQCDRWNTLLSAADTAAVQDDWVRAEQSLRSLDESWQSRQTYLHIMIEHDEIDSADTLLHLCFLYCAEKDTAALRAVVSQLQCQFSLLAETEQLSIKNVL